MGFQHVHDMVHEAASRKGGKIKVSKGYGKNRELAREAGRRGGLAKSANRGKERKPEEVSPGNGRELVDELFGNPEVIKIMKRLEDE